MTHRGSTDPRHDIETMTYWNELSDQLRAAVHALGASDAAKAALIETIDLHNAWNKSSQIFDGDEVVDVVHGVGCRSCDHLPQPNRITLEWRPYQTVQGLRRTLLPAASEPPVVPDTTQAQRAAWNAGWTARVKWEASGRTGLPNNPF